MRYAYTDRSREKPEPEIITDEVIRGMVDRLPIGFATVIVGVSLERSASDCYQQGHRLAGEDRPRLTAQQMFDEILRIAQKRGDLTPISS